MEPGSVHDGEWLAFHAKAPQGALEKFQVDSTWQDCPKVLPPERRPDERPELYAPFVVEKEGLYHMFYGPEQIRLAISQDLDHWTPMGSVFRHGRSARDPSILVNDGKYWMVYVAGESVFVRTSHDLRSWSEEPIEIFRMDRKGSPESPFVVQRDEKFYLFWCIYDGTHGLYDNRTFVYSSKTPWKLGSWEYLTQLQAHAPEIVQSEAGDWYISSAEWPARGVSLAPLEWVTSTP
jgi:sucrose-6-phosphate hydrolase SacC (GH32 family)